MSSGRQRSECDFLVSGELPVSRPLVVVNTHPIQYFAPMYRSLHEQLGGHLVVVYCSTRGLSDAIDVGFGRPIRWDVDLLEGHRSVFTDEAEANRQREPVALDCASLPRVLDESDPSGIVVHGYVGAVARTSIRWAKQRHCRLYIRGDTWAGPGEVGGPFKRMAKRLWARRFLTPHVTRFLATSELNGAYWKELGSPAERITLVPYGVDGALFRPARDLRLSNNVTKRHLRVGFFGKFTERKGILQFLRYWAAERPQALPAVTFLLAGDGGLRRELAGLAESMEDEVRILGFRNQTELPDLYRLCDVAIVPSLWETWGFSVQEALACGVPVLCGAHVPAGLELIRKGENGWILPSGDWQAWASAVAAVAGGSLQFDRSRLNELAMNVPTFEDSAQAFANALRQDD